MTVPTRRRYLLGLATGASALAGCSSDSGGDDPEEDETSDVTEKVTSTPAVTDSPCVTLDPEERTRDSFTDDVTVLSGTLLDRRGDPVPSGIVFAHSRSDRWKRGRLDTNGQFLLPLASDERYTVDYVTYCSEQSSDSLTDFYSLGTVDGSTDVDLGEVTLPMGHILSITVQNSEGERVTSEAEISIRDGGRSDSSGPPRPTYPLPKGSAEVAGKVFVTISYTGENVSKEYSVDRNQFKYITVG